jgi:AsmA protein
MKKWTKIFSAAVAVLLVLIVALIVLANILITPERVKATLLPLAEKNLQRKIDFGNIEASLFSGIQIHGLTVYELDGSEVFLSTDLVRLRYQLLPLLAIKVVVDEIRLEKPSIRIVRLKDGRFNFSDLTANSDSKEEKEGAAGNKKPSLDQQGAPINLLVSEVMLQDGHLTFIDHVLNDKAPYRYEVSALQIAAKGVSLTGKVPLSLQCQLNDSQLAIDGHINLQPLSGSLDVTLQNLDVVAFSPYLQGALPGKLGGLKLNLKSTLSGTPDEVILKGNLSLTDLDLLLDALPDAPLENANLDVNFNVLFAGNEERLQLNQLDFDYNGIKVNTKGEVAALSDQPLLNLILSVPELQLRKAIGAVPEGLIVDVSSLDPAGSLSLEAHLSGRTVDAVRLLKSATLNLKDVQATAGGQRPAFTGRLSIDGDQLSSEGLQVRLGDNQADIKLSAKNLFAKPVIVKADISSNRFLLDPLLQGSAGSAITSDQNQSKSRSGKKQSTEEIGPFDIPLQATGTIKINETVWKGLAIKDFLAQYELKDNVLNLTRVDGQVAGGSFSNSARVDLGKKGLVYSARLGLKSIQTDPLMTAFVPKAAGSLLGALDLTFALDGRGTEWNTLSRNLTGDGNMLIADGRLISPGLVGGLSKALQLPELDDIRFDSFKGLFKVADGKVNVDSQMLSSKIKLFPKGSVGLDGSLNLGLDTRLSPELSARLDKKGGISSYLADQDGWSRVPLLLKGNFNSPSFGVDPKGVQEQASKAIGAEVGRQLDKIFKRSEPATQQSDTQQSGETPKPAEDPTRKLLRDSLKNLFGN